MIYNHPFHHDGRHGHGSDEFPGRVRVKKHFFDSIQVGSLDSRLEENELILGINEDFGALAIPRVEIWKDDFVTNTTAGDVPIAALCIPGTHTMGAYHRKLGDQVLTLKRSGDHFLDDSGSKWTVEGRCVEGSSKGERLRPLDFASLEWHAFVTYHPDTEIYKSSLNQTTAPIQDACLAEACRILGQGAVISRQWPVLKAWLPEHAISGVDLVVDGHPLRLFHFAGSAEGEDWALCNAHSIGNGCLAAGSFPDRLYSDQTHELPLADDQIEWAPVIESGALDQVLESARQQCSDQHSTSARLGEVVERFQKAGYPVTRMRYLLSGELVTPAEVGFSLVLGEDPWLLLRFPSRQAADQEAQARGHCIQAGKYLLWSDPPKMYGAWLTRTRPDDRIAWSEALEDEKFIALVEDSFD
jgi:hypothetical protein